MPSMDVALVYSRVKGHRPALPIFPVTRNGKTPAVPAAEGGHGCLDATTDQDKIREWWSKYPDANIGIATGKKSGILVLDIDNKNGHSGSETLRDLQAQLGRLPDGPICLTPNGGMHLYFRYPIGVEVKTKAGLADGIDIRSNGGYVVGPPSIIDRREYCWDAGAMPDETPLPDLPQKWIDFLPKDQPGTFSLPGQIPQGERNETLFRFAASLRAKGADDEEILSKISEANSRAKPPLTESELKAIVASATRYPAGTADHRQQKRPRLSLDALAAEMENRSLSARFNLITRETEVAGKRQTDRRWSLDDLAVFLHDELADSYTFATSGLIGENVAFIARERQFNPVLDHLHTLHWDGKSRLQDLYSLMRIPPNDPISAYLIHCWLRQTIALLFNGEGGQNAPFGAEGVLVLNGPQGTGKTSLLRCLALRPAWFREGASIDSYDKDTKRRCVTTWICELGELESTLKSDIADLKAFITNPTDAYRLPYAKADTISPRHTSFAATCNSDQFLIDVSGNRRFFTIPVTQRIPYAEIEDFPWEQLWAEVFAEVSALPYDEKAKCFRLSPEVQAALEQRNAGFQKKLKGQQEVEDILTMAAVKELPTRPMTTTEFKQEWPALKAYSAQQIGAALAAAGVPDGPRSNTKRTRNLPMNIPQASDFAGTIQRIK